MSGYIVAIDQGTTSTRAIVFDADQRIVGVGQKEFAQHFPRPGWVEHDPQDLWATSVETVRQALASAGLSGSQIAALGITNQRETTLVWNRRTGEPIHRAIVWQDRRTADLCARLRQAGHEAAIAAATGLVIDPYFSATKVAWILENVEGARAAAEAGELAFGTVDSWLIWKLTGGRRHVTDATNAGRTLLYNIHTNAWEADILDLLGVPQSMLPEVLDCDAAFGTTLPELFGAEIPVLGVAGDQQAATLGQACFSPGMLKSTYGTGCFALLNTGRTPAVSKNRLLTTIAYRLSGETIYALEGAIFIAGAAVQWLRDGLRVLERADQSGPMAAEADPDQHVYLVPAFVGLGTPHWDPDARGAIFGLTRGTGPKELARAALESVCYQTADLIGAMRDDWPGGGAGDEKMVLRVDGGMVASDWTMQRLADIMAAPVDRPGILETTALGAAWLAGQKAGVWPGQEGFAETWRLDRRFEPSMPEDMRQAKLAGWRDAIARTLSRR